MRREETIEAADCAHRGLSMATIWASASEDGSQPGRACSPNGQQLACKYRNVQFSGARPQSATYYDLLTTLLQANI
jgi:hypothetical protein